MAQKNINIGSSANKGDGDPIRTAFSKTQDNFTDLYSRLIVVESATGTGNPGGATIQQSIIGDVIGQDSTLIIDSNNSTVNATTVNSQNITGNFKGSVVADDSTVLIDGVNGTISAGALTGSLPAIDGSALTGISATTLNGQAASHYLDFANFTNTPTTLAGYGITDSLQLGTSATTALAGNTALFSGAFADLTSKPTTIAGYGITDATSTASPAFTGAVDFTGATSVDFTGATISGTSFLTSIPNDLDAQTIKLSKGNSGFEYELLVNEIGSDNPNGRILYRTYNNRQGVAGYDYSDHNSGIVVDTNSDGYTVVSGQNSGSSHFTNFTFDFEHLNGSSEATRIGKLSFAMERFLTTTLEIFFFDKGKIGSGLHPVIIIRSKILNKNFIYYNVLKKSKLISQISSILDNDLFLSTLNNCKI